MSSAENTEWKPLLVKAVGKTGEVGANGCLVANGLPRLTADQPTRVTCVGFSGVDVQNVCVLRFSHRRDHTPQPL